MEANKTAKAMWFLVTLNMPDKVTEWEELLLLAEPLKAKYMVGQVEAAPETGMKHWHVVLKLEKQTRCTALLKAFGLGTNVKAVTKGTEDTVIEYATKEESRIDGPYVFGQRPVQLSSKRDWDRIHEDVKAGRFDQVPADILIKHYGNLKAIRHDTIMGEPYNHHRCRGLWIMGKAGLGKSHFVNVFLKDRFKTVQDKNLNKWFDGYVDQKVISIQDIDPNHVYLLDFMKRWADKWSFAAEVKGSTVVPKHHLLCVTSNHTIDQVFRPTTDDEPGKVKITHEDLNALRRRFVVLKMFGEAGKPETTTVEIYGDGMDGEEFTPEAAADWVYQTFTPPETN